MLVTSAPERDTLTEVIALPGLSLKQLSADGCGGKRRRE
jgi:hypothetical protein